MENHQVVKKTRAKAKTITLYVNPKYTEKLTYLKYTGGITKFIEHALDGLEIDETLMRSIKCIEFAKDGK
jgi:hypothetical protein